uniref:Uncharacterized protein n=1 Tax=Nelumbo nucifera TaxID=4432 RepID=A0A823A0L2_NELNU|nr:TPA_asm: hypothetical protein HUJ06_017655 [Nelumbo nucifera]
MGIIREKIDEMDGGDGLNGNEGISSDTFFGSSGDGDEDGDDDDGRSRNALSSSSSSSSSSSFVEMEIAATCSLKTLGTMATTDGEQRRICPSLFFPMRFGQTKQQIK